MSENIRVGFWGPDKDLPIPLPNPESWKGQAEFLAKLIDLELSLNTVYIAMVKQYNNDMLARRPNTVDIDGGNVVAYRGSSRCRCCHRDNGNHEYRYNGWTWPEGYRHYLEDHNVLPDAAFKDFVMKL